MIEKTSEQKILEAIQALSIKTDNSIQALSIKTDNSIQALSIKTDNSIQALSDRMDERFNRMEINTNKRFDETENEINTVLEAMNVFSSQTDAEFRAIRKILNTLAPRDYVDEKCNNTKGDLIEIVRKEDTKIKKLIAIHLQRKQIDKKEAKEILDMEPFGQLTV